MKKDKVKDNNLEDIAGGSTHTRFDPYGHKMIYTDTKYTNPEYGYTGTISGHIGNSEVRECSVCHQTTYISA